MVAVAAPQWSDGDDLELAALLDDEDNGEGFDAYIRRVSPRHPPPRHIKPIIDLWERTRTERVLACIELPPRHAKTTTGMHGLAWRLFRDPTLTNAFATYSDDYAASRSRIARTLTQSGGVKLDRSMANLHEWRSAYGGGAIFRGYMGAWTGQGIDGVALVDDPYKDRAAAESKKIRDNTWDWFNDVLWLRLEPPAGSGARAGSCIIQHCIARGEPILMADGTWRAVEKVVPGEFVASLGNGGFVGRKVLDARASGSDPIHTIRAAGNETRCNARHPFLLETGEWRQAGDLRVGDRVVVLDHGFGTEEIDPEFAWLFGFMMGDGWVTSWKRRNHDKKRGRIYESRSWCVCVARSVYPELNERACAAIGRFFGRRPKHCARFGYYRLDSNDAGRKLESLGLTGGAHGKRIPRWVFALRPDLKREYLRGYVEADGHRLARCADSWQAASVSRDLIEDARLLAISAGIRCGRVTSSTQIVRAPNSAQASSATMWKVSINFARPPDRITTIKSIERGESADVFDLAVDGAENFVAGGFVVHNTRWHEDDLIGRLLKGKFAGYHFERIHLPAICDSDDDILGRAVGDALWPERFPVEELRKIEASIGPYSWASLFQQNPRPKGADVFNEPSRFMLKDFSWQGKRILLCCDPAATDDNKGDFSAAFVLAAEGFGDEMKIWVIHGWRDHLTIPDLVTKLIELQNRFWKAPIAVEAVGGFKAVPQTLRAINSSIRLRAITRVIGDKFTRAQPLAAAWNAGRVFIPLDATIVRRKGEAAVNWRGDKAVTWADELIEEASLFTGLNDAEDDQVDAMSHGFNEMRGARIVKRGSVRNRNPFG